MWRVTPETRGALGWSLWPSHCPGPPRGRWRESSRSEPTSTPNSPPQGATELWTLRGRFGGSCASHAPNGHCHCKVPAETQATRPPAYTPKGMCVAQVARERTPGEFTCFPSVSGPGTGPSSPAGQSWQGRAGGTPRVWDAGHSESALPVTRRMSSADAGPGLWDSWGFWHLGLGPMVRW